MRWKLIIVTTLVIPECGLLKQLPTNACRLMRTVIDARLRVQIPALILTWMKEFRECDGNVIEFDVALGPVGERIRVTAVKILAIAWKVNGSWIKITEVEAIKRFSRIWCQFGDVVEIIAKSTAHSWTRSSCGFRF